MTRKTLTPVGRFYAGFLLPLLLCFLLLEASALLLVRSGEYLDLAAVIARLEETHGVYGTALSQKTIDLKKDLYRHIQPAVAAVGSSRVMQLRQEDFSVPFVNLGVGDLDEAADMSKTLFPDHKPSLVLFGIDFWWFADDGRAFDFVPTPADTHISMADRFMPLTWALSGKLGFADMAHIVAQSSPNVGITGISRGDGFALDGSYTNIGMATKRIPSDDYKFGVSRDKIAGGKKNYVHADHLSEAEWKKFTALLDFYRQQGINVVLFLPPLAPSILPLVEKGPGYGYVAELRKRLPAAAARYGMAFYDDLDAAALGATDCEFFDAHHGGPVVYKRILAAMAASDDRVGKVVKLAETRRDIAVFKGHATTLASGEKDFLGLGCIK